MFNFGNLAELMKQFQTIRENVDKAKEELKRENIVVEVGGGMVKVTANGMGEILDIEIDKSLLKEEEYQVLKELIVSAVNETFERSKEVMTQKISEATGLPANMSKFGGLF
ncbi:MAG TPA: YbaB/EbfC family nucleoid-associated protein [Sulfurihydrogenibium azorense]|uniref:Nucleoid-associated protein ENO34_01660 n=1 Tax=Sulfurihydrogenibium azorense TaxID=309806 RepID=A0A831YD58_9AQUI|nr:YbaB/EbfC family nucleoid-associated protein [Sulfurihydrogenibium azorense]